MHIDAAREGDSIVLRLRGRCDREWAEHLSATLDALVRDGARSLVVDLADVTYVSSPAMEVLARSRQELAALRGEVRVTSIPPAVRETFEICGWSTGPDADGAGGAELRRSSWHLPALSVRSGEYQTSVADRDATLRCRLHGDPARLAAWSLDAGDRDVVPLAGDVFALGLGAIGTAWDDCRERLGELVAAAGCAAYFPGDGARMADYLVGDAPTPPRVLIASGLSCAGGFSRLVRFTARADTDAVPLAELAGVCLDAVGGRAAGLLIAAESAGLAGARIRRSPGADGASLRFEVPAIRDWLEFAPERIHLHATALIAGVVARRPEGRLADHLRPLAAAGGLAGHLHAAVFSYRPLPQRTVDLHALVQGLFRTHELLDVLHLLRDDRADGSAGESALRRGVGWVAPIVEFA